MLWYTCWNRNNNEHETNKQKETTTVGGPSYWIIKHEIPNWFLGRLFNVSFLFCICFSFSFFFPFFSLFLFLLAFLSLFFFFFRILGRPEPPGRPACYAPQPSAIYLTVICILMEHKMVGILNLIQLLQFCFLGSWFGKHCRLCAWPETIKRGL